MPKISDLFSRVYQKNKLQKLNVLGVLGSPRLGGNSDILLDKTLEGARSLGAQVEKIILNNLRFSPCQECEKMPDDGSCIIDDDMQNVYRQVQMADVLILAAPIFFGSLSAQVKMMIDRFQCLWRAKYILNKNIITKQKIGAFICVEASQREDFFNNARSIVKNFFATVNTDYKEELLCPGIDEKGSVLTHADILEKAFSLGQRLVGPEKKIG